MELKLYIRQKRLVDKNGQEEHIGGQRGALQLLSTPLPAHRRFPKYGSYLDITQNVSDLHKLKLTWTLERNTQGIVVAGTTNQKKAASRTLTFEGAAYSYLKQWLVDDLSAAVNVIAAQLVDKEASHPYIIEASTDCPDCSGRGNVQRDCEDCPGGVELAQCRACAGSGQISRNPGQRMIVPHEDMDKGTPIQIINPDVTINTHHREVCSQVMGLIIEALHLQKTDEAQSGVAKAIDQERLYKFISAISNDVFDKILYDTLRDIIAYRNADGDHTQAFRLVKPTQFRIKTGADLLAEYSEGTKAGMPVFVRRRMAMDYVDKQYSGDELMKRKAQLITELDELSVLSTAEIADLHAIGAVTNADINYSRKLPLMIDQLVQEKGDYWLLNTPVKKLKPHLVKTEEVKKV